MKTGRVRVDSGASVGSGTVVLYGTLVGAEAVLGARSLLAKGESLPPNTRWEGIPAQFASRCAPTGTPPEMEGSANT